ncbi:ubiquitin family protein [bacterium]|nr:ubiquitin family protein [bacterium]
MTIKVALPTAQVVTVEAVPEDTVLRVKEFVYNVTEIHVGNQRMFKNAAELDNMKTLASYGVADGDTLQVKYGVDDSGEQVRATGGWWKILIIIVILAAVALWVKKKVFSGEQE